MQLITGPKELKWVEETNLKTLDQAKAHNNTDYRGIMQLRGRRSEESQHRCRILFSHGKERPARRLQNLGGIPPDLHPPK